MNAKLGGLAAGRGDAQHHQAANVARETRRAFPDVAIDIGIDDILQRRAEFAGRRHPLLDVGVAETSPCAGASPRAYISLVSTFWLPVNDLYGQNIQVRPNRG